MAQTEYIGAGTLARVADILASIKPKKIFLAVGKSSFGVSGAQAVLEPLLSGAEVLRYDDFAAIPLEEDMQKGLDAYYEFSPDMVIAVGGGHVMDAAKIINARGSQVPLVAVPTTAGSGAESTPFAVVYKDGVKRSEEDPRILPAYAIVDPLLCASAPRSAMLASALDALAQSIESAWSLRATDESQAYSAEALQLAWSSIAQAVDKKDPAAIERLVRGAHLAGKAIAIAKTTVCHALSYGLTYRFGVPHGIAVAATLPTAMRFNGASYGAITADAVENLLRDLCVPRLREFNVGEGDVPSLAAEVNLERLANNPRPLSAEDVSFFFQRAL